MDKLILEIWRYKAKLPNSVEVKLRPVLVIGNDAENKPKIVDIHYCIVSATAPKGEYDIEIEEKRAKELGLDRKSVIKLTKIYTGSQSLLEGKICDLPSDTKKEFIKNYKAYQSNLISIMEENVLLSDSDE